MNQLLLLDQTDIPFLPEHLWIVFKNMNEDIFTVRDIFDPIVNYVTGGFDQVPVLDTIRNSGHGSGVFVFYRKRGITE